MSLRKIRRRGARRLTGVALLGLAVASLSACGDLGQGPGQARLFGLPEASSEQAPYIGNLWVGSWIASLVIGVLVWGLIGWAFIVYRR
ncbi:MAG: cytochrome c oxidase subunit II, partial [Propionibacteriaceae bacterium]|nr:cytochrome c oxidase subunit II [Propionibacteriaceae bacterium]